MKFFDVLTHVWGCRFVFWRIKPKPFTPTTPHMHQHPWKHHKMGIFFGGVWLYKFPHLRMSSLLLLYGLILVSLEGEILLKGLALRIYTYPYEASNLKIKWIIISCIESRIATYCKNGYFFDFERGKTTNTFEDWTFKILSYQLKWSFSATHRRI